MTLKRQLSLASRIAAAGLLTTFAFSAQPAQQDSPVEAITVDKKYHADIYAENRGLGDVTVTLKAETSNVYPSVALPLTKSLSPRSKHKLVRLNAKDKGKPWRYRFSFVTAYGSLDTKHDDRVLYRLPYQKGAKVAVTQSFGGKISHQGELHHSVDFAMPVGSRVCAARAGLVVRTRSSSNKGGPSEKYKNDGNYVHIQHADKSLGVYVHFKKDGVLVKVGDQVRRGRVIGLSGNTGWSSAPHLHFGVCKLLGGGIGKSLPFRFETKRGTITTLVQGTSYSVK